MKVLLTGSGGVVGSEVLDQIAALGPDIELTAVTRRPSRSPEQAWVLGVEPPPVALQTHWDVIVHSAASTRWTMTRDEAIEANVETTRAICDLADRDTHLIHISTAYVDGQEPAPGQPASEFGRYRNAYEWSKYESENVVIDRHHGPLTIVRPPLVFGRSTDGAIARLTGPYAMVQSLVSGLAPTLVGDPDGFLELAGVDQVAAAVVSALTSPPPAGEPMIDTIAAGDRCLRVSDMVEVITQSVNEWRGERGIDPIRVAPVISSPTWHKFFLPLCAPHLSVVQRRAVGLLEMFESYTSISAPFEPNSKVENPAAVLSASVRWWADAKPRLAKRSQDSWSLVDA